MTVPFALAIVLLQASSAREWRGGGQGTSPSQSNLVLKGLTTITISKMRQAPESRSLIDTYELARLIEDRLRERGVPVHGIDGPGGQLSLAAAVIGDSDSPTASVSVTLALWEEVELRRAPGAILKLPTWSQTGSERGSRAPVKTRLHDAALHVADRFADAWEKAHKAVSQESTPPKTTDGRQ